MTLHVYAQTCEHADAYVVGTRADLIKLRASIDLALGARANRCSSESVEAYFDSAGEEYDLYVKVADEAIEFDLALPYANSIGRSMGRNLSLPYASLALDRMARGEFTPDRVPTE